MRETIAKAVQIYRNNPTLNDNELFETLVSEGIEHHFADELMKYLPMAYTHVLFADLGIKPNLFYEKLDNQGNILPWKLTDERLYNEIVAYAQEEIGHGVSREDMVLVAYSSSEFKAIASIMMKDMQPPSITSHNLKVIPEPIPMGENLDYIKKKPHQKKWWQFWR